MNENTLPQGWIEASLGDFLDLLYGRSLPKKRRIGQGFPVYGSSGIIDHHVEALTSGETIIIGRKGSIGEINYSPGPCFPIDTTYYVDQFYGMSSRYWFYLLRYLHLSDLNRATAIPGLNREDVNKLSARIAPVNEQNRIVNILDRLLTQISECQERLERVRLIVEYFRQSVLREATSGALTYKWRVEKNADQVDLMSFEFEDARCLGDYQFPSSWQALRLGKIAEITTGITRSSKLQDLSYEEIPYLRVANVQRGYFDLSEVKTIRAPQEQIESRLLETGDILFNEGGDIDKLGRGWVWSGEIDRCTFQNHVFRARLHDTEFNPKFFSYYGNSRGADYFFAFGKQTTNLASINKAVLSALPVAVPPADEQHEIVRRIESLFALADRVESHYQTARDSLDQLVPALLNKAFNGKLVPQDPKDEPASVLLERIREARANALAQPQESVRRVNVDKKKPTSAKKTQPISVIEALREANRELSVRDLFHEAGYPVDAESELVEAFFVAIRDALENDLITRTRRHDTDWFALNSEATANEDRLPQS